MAPEDPVTHWIDQLKAGDSTAAQKLWERYFQQLVSMARAKLHGRRHGPADGEDVALSAFDSFCRGAERGRFPQLHDREDLRRLLIKKITIYVNGSRQGWKFRKSRRIWE